MFWELLGYLVSSIALVTHPFRSIILFAAPPLFAEHKCRISDTYLDIAWEPVEYDLPITAYILELEQDKNNFNEVSFSYLLQIEVLDVELTLFFEKTFV